MSAYYSCGHRRPLTLCGKTYPRGAKLPTQAVEGLKATTRRALLERGEIVFQLSDTEVLAPEYAASRVDVRARG